MKIYILADAEAVPVGYGGCAGQPGGGGAIGCPHAAAEDQVVQGDPVSILEKAVLPVDCSKVVVNLEIITAFVQHRQVILHGEIVGHAIARAQAISAARQAYIQRVTHATTNLAATRPAQEIHIDAA